MEKFLKWIGKNFLTIVLILVIVYSGDKILKALDNVYRPIVSPQIMSPPPNTVVYESNFENEVSRDGKTLKSKVKVTLKELPKGGKVYLLYKPQNSQEDFKEVELKNTGALHYYGELEVSTSFNYDLEVLVKGDLTTLSAPIQKLEAIMEADSLSPIEVSMTLPSFNDKGEYTYQISALNFHHNNEGKKVNSITAIFSYKGKEIMQLVLNKDNCEVEENYESTIFNKTGTGKVDPVSFDEFYNDFNITILAESNDGYKYHKSLHE